ncbi:DUF3141 domain-containing protein [Alcaligenaceae bacterium SJ-26]|nr:DUF3141 domain-containing protein [Alcaligenaceae bacterium SJ-26]
MRDHQTFNPLGEFFRHLTPPAGTAGLPGPWAAYEYALDAWQRSVLLLDVLRQRANRPGNNKAETAAAQDSDAEAVLGQEAARLLAALQRLSEVDAAHYEQHVRPLLEKTLTPVFAHLLIERQVLRLDDAVFSDRNPLMQGVAQLAATVRAERHPAGSDNPYLLLQQQLSSLLADALHTYADLRDQAVEQVFLTLRALPESSQLPDFVQGTQPAEAKFKASVPAAQADAPAKAIAKPAVAAKVPAAKVSPAKKTAPGKPAAAAKSAKSPATKPVGTTPAVSAPTKPAAARAAKPSRSQSASQQASLPGVAERPAVVVPAAVSPAVAQPGVAAVPAAAPQAVVAPAVPHPVTKPASPAQPRPGAKPVASVAPTPKPVVKKTVAAPGSKTTAATPAAAMAATIAALAAPAEKTVPARSSASTTRKTPVAKPAATKSDTTKAVSSATPRKR